MCQLSKWTQGIAKGIGCGIIDASEARASDTNAGAALTTAT